MQVLHLQLYPKGETSAELRFFSNNPSDYEVRSLSLNAIADLIEQAEGEYYFPQESRLLRRGLSAENYAETGKMLYDWLDGTDRLLTRTMQQYSGKGLVLAIDASQKLAHLPWEVLHDGNNFLVARTPAVVPVRWVSSDIRQLSIATEPENRALQVLFMATSPEGVKPELQFEAEEGRILEATARQPLALVVEESGSLTELGYLIDDYGKDYFDVLHLTGHATITEEGEPRFYTETETGELYLASAADIAKSLKSRLPQLIFLSGCRTGQGGKLGAVPSLAEGLLKLGAKAVLGWGQTVLDTDATAAAAALYGELAAGYEVTEALSRTYQALIGQQARDWHLLRLYVGRALPGQLVTTLRTPGRKRAPKPSVVEQFLDVDTKQVKVASRGSFVGRRRQLQSCLRALKNPPSPPYQGGNTGKTPPYQGGNIGKTLPYQGGNIGGVGVLIHGMGGLGKSTLAARLCDRLPEFERIVWVGRMDEASLVKRLTEKLRSKELRQVLQSFDDELKFRLRDVFERLEEEAAQPFLLVLDDFEANLEPRNDGYVLQPEAAMVLEALLWAIGETYARHRLILTCRYDFESEWLQEFYKQPMERLRGADEEKKCNRLSAFAVNSLVDEALQLQARRLADGNPRLLEWLDKVLLLDLEPPPVPLGKGEARDFSPLDKGGWGGSQQGEKNIVAEILARLEMNPVELREQVLAKALLEQIDPTLEEILRRGLVYELPVPREAIAAVCEEIPNLEQQINRAVALGLLEVSPDESLRVPRILPLKLPEDAERLHKQAADVLYRLWWGEGKTEERFKEIHRLALRGRAGKIAVEIANALTKLWKNQSRFREAVQLCKLTLEFVEDYRILHHLAQCEQQLGEVGEALAHYQQALVNCPQEDEKEKAAIIHNLGHHKVDQGQIEEALTLFKESLTLNEDIGNLQGKAVILHELGRLKTNQGKIEEAIALSLASLALNEGISDVRTKAATLHQLGTLKSIQGQVEAAIFFYQQSLALNEGIGNVQGMAATLHELGNLKVAQGKIEEAIAFYQQSLALKKDIGDVKGIAATLHQLAYLKANSGQIVEALSLFKQSLVLEERSRDFQGKAATVWWLGHLAEQQGDLDTALNYLQQSLEILQRIQSPDAEKVREAIARVQQQTDDRG
jgi:tetratricopeptide (TPR) repeat protein